MILNALGGLGLFLLGMVIMTDGLRGMAGDAIRRALIRFTHSPVTGAMSGAACTAILQSSSATTVAAVGFVAADLMSFPAALGIVFGANVGTTITGWMVQLIGFKLKLGLLSLVLVLFGALLRLLAGGRIGSAGMTIAGFGLVFVGVSEMQQGMAALQELLSFESLPGDTLLGRATLLGFGIGFTIIAQSSSAGVAATLTALMAGLIDVQQGAALVIGMDVGSTVTAAVATIGTRVDARRTGLSHVIFNLLTGALGLALIDPYLAMWEVVSPGSVAENPGTALVGFHSTFNIIGVLAILPFARPFARLVTRLIPDSGVALTGQLDPGLLDEPTRALNAASASIRLELRALLAHVAALLDADAPSPSTRLPALQTALDETQAFVDRIRPDSPQGDQWQRLLATIHTLDHLQRLHERCEEDADRASTARTAPGLAEPRRELSTAIEDITRALDDEAWLRAAQRAQQAATRVIACEEPYRASIMEQIGRDELDVPEGTEHLNAVRWLTRVSRHVERTLRYSADAVLAAGGQDEDGAARTTRS